MKIERRRAKPRPVNTMRIEIFRGRDVPAGVMPWPPSWLEDEDEDRRDR